MNFGSFINQNFNKTDLGLLIIRLTFGILITLAGVQKLLGGTSGFEQIGAAMAIFGITWQPMLWGLLCALVETLGGICVVLGLFFRPATLLLFLNMIVATAFMVKNAGGVDVSSFDAFMKFVGMVSLPKIYCLTFLALLLMGPGKYSLQKGGGRGFSKSSAKD